MSPRHLVALCVLLASRALAQTPAPSGMLPRFGPPGTTVTVSGTGLNQPGMVPRIGYQKKYIESGESRSASISATLNANNTVTFAAPPNAQPESFTIGFEPVKGGTLTTTLLSQSFRIPGRFDVMEPPSDIRASNAVMVILPGGVRPAITPGESFRVTGRNLVPRPGTNTTLTVAGISIPVTAATYNPAALSGRGLDELTVNPSDPPAFAFGSAVVTTAGGSLTDNNWVYQKLPRVTGIEELSGTVGGTVTGTVSMTGRMTRGRRYQLRGTDLQYSLPDGPRRPQLFFAVAGTAPLLATIDAAASNATLLRFTVPLTLTASQVRLELRPPAGNTTVISAGTHELTDPGIAPPPLASIVVAPSPAVMGSTINVTVSFAGSITPGTDVGALVVTTGSTASSSPLQTVQVPITSNPMTVPVPTEVHSIARTLVAKARVTRATGGVDSVSTTYQLSAPSLTSLTTNTPSITGGISALVRANFDFQGTTGLFCSSPTSGTITASYESSDTSVAVVMGSGGFTLGNPMTMCANANPFPVTVSTRRQTTTRPVTITGRFNNVVRTLTLNVLPTTINAITVNRPSLTSLQSATGTITLTGPMSGQFALLSSSDPAVSVPNKLSFTTATSYTFPITTLPVSSPRTVTITAVSGETTRTVSISLQPLQFTNFTLQPATVTAGSNSAATLQLNAPIDVGFTATVTSSNPSAVTVPATVTFAPGQNGAVFNVQSIGPRSTPASVNITVTYTVNVPNVGAVTATIQRTLTVNP
jgi:hypothetical protein